MYFESAKKLRYAWKAKMMRAQQSNTREVARLLTTAVTLIVVGLVAGFGFWRMFAGKGKVIVAPQVWIDAIAAQETAAKFHATPLRLENTSQLVNLALEALPGQIPTEDPTRSKTPADVRAPLELVVGWLAARSQGDIDAYRTWATSQDLHLTKSLPEATMLSMQDISDMYAMAIGDSMPDNITPRQFFKKLYVRDETISNGALRPDAIVTEAPAIEAMFANVRSFQDIVSITLPSVSALRSDTLGPDFWNGGISMFARRLWQSGNSIQDLARGKRAGAQAVVLRLVVAGASGLRTPMTFVLLYDDIDNRWRLEAIWLNNVGPDPKGKLLAQNPAMYVF